MCRANCDESREIKLTRVAHTLYIYNIISKNGGNGPAVNVGDNYRNFALLPQMDNETTSSEQWNRTNGFETISWKRGRNSWGRRGWRLINSPPRRRHLPPFNSVVRAIRGGEGWDDSGRTNRGAEVCVESLLTRAETGESRGRFVAVQSGWLDGGGEDWRREGRVSTQRR